MISRSILTNKDSLGIFIDSQSFNKLLDAGNVHANTILKYIHTKDFDFVRSPCSVNHGTLSNITAYTEKYDTKGNLKAIEIIGEDFKLIKSIGFRYQIKDIEQIGRVIYKDKALIDEDMKTLILIYIHAAFNGFDKKNIFITDNNDLLNNRLWLESQFPMAPLNITNVIEAKEVMDLFAKKQKNKYYISGNYTCNKAYYYWLSFRSKVPHYHLKDKYLNALANRFVNLLMSLDEIGFNYYRDANNDTSADIMYHFNYHISLVTGIFDSLAYSTKEHYKIDFPGSANLQRLSLRRKTGKEFLKAIRERNPTLRKHINEYVDLINLVYELRETILHREMMENTIYENWSRDERWKAVFIKIESDIKDCNYSG
jgi:hypothetical protein